MSDDMQTHPALIERSVDATLSDFSRGKLTCEEATLDLFELVSMQMNGRTHYGMTVIGYYIRAILTGMANRRIEMADAFDAFVDAAAQGNGGHSQITRRLAVPLAYLRQ